MSQRTKGKCKYCGKEYTMSYMNKHLSTCAERQKILAAETGSSQCGYFQLAISSKYDKDYWMFIEICETVTLKYLDAFLRDIWLECCGHLSAFTINGVAYEIMPNNDLWGELAKSMDYKLKSVLKKGMTIKYEYDFGSTTELLITVVNYRIGDYQKEALTILSRNNPRVFICDKCGKNNAVVISSEYAWTGKGLLCEECLNKSDDDEDMFLNICNSPRMGVCAYEGSDIYPDWFISDTEKGIYHAVGVQKRSDKDMT